MTHFRFSALSLLFAILLCLPTAHAQQTNSGSTEQTADAAVREKAFKLLESLADQLGTLQSPENRARIGANIAESIWTRDEKRARALFASVAEDINLGLQNQPKGPQAELTFLVFLKLREDTLERIAKRDPELAFAFLQRTKPEFGAPLPPALTRSEHALEMRVAKKVAASSPEVAVKLARQALAQTESRDLVVLLIKLSGKDKQQTLELYKEAVNKVRDSDLREYWPNMDFAQNLLRYFTPPAADESTYRELIDILLSRAFANGCGRPRREDSEERTDLCGHIGGLLPIIARFSPAQAQRLKHWASEDMGYHATLVDQAYLELNELTENGTVDEILALAPKYPELEGQIRLRAMWKAEGQGDLERARKMATDYSGDPEVEHAMKARVQSYNRAAITEKELADAESHIATLPVQQQIELLLNLPLGVASHDASLRILNQAASMIDTLGPGRTQTELQIRLALVYCVARDDRGFAIMESVMPKLNDLVAAAIKLDGYDTNYLRDGEWNMSGEGAVGNILTTMARNAGYFAWCDFERAVALASQFERSEIRMMAQLKLAQAILAGPPKRPPGMPMRFYGD